MDRLRRQIASREAKEAKVAKEAKDPKEAKEAKEPKEIAEPKEPKEVEAKEATDESSEDAGTNEVAQLRRELAELRKHNEKLEREAKMHNAVGLFRKTKKTAESLLEENERLKSEMELAEAQSLEQMDGLKKSIRALTAQVEQLEAERSRHWASSAGASAKADETIRQLEAQLRAAQQRIHQAEVDAEAAAQDAGSQIARLQEQALEHVQTINRLHEELRESRQFILTNTEASLASERQLGQLEQSLRHEQESRQRAEAELATAKGESRRLAQRVEDLQAQLEATRQDVLRGQGADAAVKGVVEAVQQELAAVRSELVAREATLAELQRTLADERSARASEVATLQRSLEDAQRQAFVQATQAAEAHRAELAAAEEMLAAVREGGAEARSQLQQAQAANATLRDRIAVLERQAAAAAARAADLEAEVAAQTERATAAAALQDELTAKTQELEQALERLQAERAAETEEHARRTVAADAKVQDLRSQLEEESRAAQENARRLQQAEAEYTALVVKSNENHRVLQELATSISEAEARIDMLAREKEGLAAELQQAQAARAAADKDAADAAAAHAKAVAAAEQAHKADLEAQRERHAGELAQLQGQLRAAQDELEKIPVARDHLQLRTKSVNQDRTINEMAVKIAEVEAEARKRQNAQMDADRLQAEVEELNGYLAEAEKELETAQARHAQELQTLKEEADQLRAALKAAGDRIEALSVTVEAKETEIAERTNELERLRPLEVELAEAKAQLEDLQTQITKLEEDLAQARQQIEDGDAERKALERKHASILKDMQRQLDRERKSSASGPPTVAVSRTRSDISTQPSPRASTPTSEAPSLTQENEALVQRLAEAQTQSWNLEDQQRALRLRIRNLEEELRVKTEVIQQYMLREFAGELKPLPGPVAATLALANQGSSVAAAALAGGNGDQSPMKAVQAAAGALPSPVRSPKKGKAPAPDANVLLQINSRLQAVLEDLITKNTRLQARVDQLEKGFGDAGQPSPRA